MDPSKPDTSIQNEKKKKPKKSKKTSNLETLLHIIKTNVGIGILALPQAISNVGLLMGLLGIVVLSSIAVYCMHLLVIYSKEIIFKINEIEIREHLEDEDHERKLSLYGETNKDLLNEEESEESKMLTRVLDYQTTVEKAFEFGPKKFQKWSFAMRHIVNILIILTQFGFCCGYFVFTAKNLSMVTQNLNGSRSLNMSEILMIEWPVMIVFNLIPNLKMLAIISAISIALQGVSLAMLCGFFFSGSFSNNINYVVNTSVGKWPLYFGTVMFSFESIAVMLPLENDMKHKENFIGWFGVLNAAMCIVVMIYLFIGGGGYAKYGSDAKPSITLNIPVGAFSEIIRITFALAIFLSYPLQMYVPFTFILPYLREKVFRESFKKWHKYVLEVIFRAVLVTITFGIALAVPLLDLIISLVGAFTGTALAIILPPILELVCIWDASDMKYRTARIVSDILLIIFGMFGLCTGATISIMEIVEKIRKGDTE